MTSANDPAANAADSQKCDHTVEPVPDARTTNAGDVHIAPSAQPSSDRETPADSEALEPWWNGRIMTGFVDEIHGRGSEVCQYPVTRAELLALARHWLQEIMDIHLDWFYYAQTGSREIRIGPYARRRLARIAAIVGDEAVRGVWQQIEDEHRRQVGERDWEAFQRGESGCAYKDEEAYQAFWDAKEQDKKAQDAAFEYLRLHPTGYLFDNAGDLWTLVRAVSDPGKLMLRVTSPDGRCRYFGRTVEMPPGWHAPFGIHE